MTTDRPSEYAERVEPCGAFRVRVVSFRLGSRYHCSVDNVDPGAVVARAEAATRQEAEAAALKQARERIERTRVVGL